MSNSRIVATALFLGLALEGSAQSTVEQPTVEQIVAAVEQVYDQLEGYQDVGEIEVAAVLDDVEEAVVHYFETRMVSDRFIWRLRSPARDGFVERVFWIEDEALIAYDDKLRQTKELPSMTSELVERFGPLAFDSLSVVSALASRPRLLSQLVDPRLEGIDSCGQSATCYIVSSQSAVSETRMRVWVDDATFLIRQIESSETTTLEVDTTDQKPKKRRRKQEEPEASLYSSSITVRHQPETEPAEVEHLATGLDFDPPSFATAVSDWIDGLPDHVESPSVTPTETPQAVFYDQVDVRLLTVHIRAFDRRGQVLRDLTPEDLVVRIGSEIAPIATVEWHGVGDEPGAHDQQQTDPVDTSQQPELVVIYLQNDFHPGRIKGQLGLLPWLQRLVHGLDQGTEIAIFSYFRHLAMWQDFSPDRESAANILEKAVFPGARPRHLTAGETPFSLMPHFEPRQAARAATNAEGVALVSRALAAVPGTKSMIYAGYSLGGRGVVRALLEAQTTPFILDTTQADFHTFEGAMEGVALATGGTYSSTFSSRPGAVNRVRRLLTGYYSVVIDGSSLDDRGGRLKIKLDGKRGVVHYPPIGIRWQE